MAIYTPHGLKVRISIPEAFGLMARLAPKVSPFQVLQATEGIIWIPGMFAFIAGMIAFGTRQPPLVIFLEVGSAQLVGLLINHFGFYVSPGLVSLATLFSYVAGFGLFFAITVAVGLFTVGWWGVLVYFIGRCTAGLIGVVLAFWQTGRNKKLTGVAFTDVEVAFFNAYRVHATLNGVTTNLELQEAELEQDHWLPTFEKFAIEWPEIVQRFTNN